jgi:tetratricopeptide (TPR) repeat protein
MIRSVSWDNIVRIFTSIHYAHYHPLVILSFAVEYHFFELDPWIYHATNLFLHALNALFVFLLIRSLRGGTFVPLLAALLFAVHPLHVESVAWATERKDVLYTFFYLTALILYISYVRLGRYKLFYLVLAAFLFSLLSKAMAITLPFVLLLFDFFLDRKFDKWVCIEKIPLVGLSAIFGAVVLWATYPERAQVQSVSFGVDNFLVAAYGILFYLQKFFVPWPLSALYPYPVALGETLPWQFWISPIFLLILLGVTLWTLRGTKVLTFGLSFMILTAAPVLQLTKVGGVIAADRFVYVPLLGFIFVFAEGVHWLYENKFKESRLARRSLVAVLAIIVAGLSFLTWNRVQVWKDSISLWDDVIRQFEGVAATYNNRGMAFAEKKEWKRAIDEYTRGISLQDDDWKLYYNRGRALREVGALLEAIDDLTKAISLNPTDSYCYYYRALAYHHAGKLREALDDYTQAIVLYPFVAEFFVNRGVVYGQVNEFQSALADFDRALNLTPDDGEIYFNKGFALRFLGKLDEALAEFTNAIAMQPAAEKNYLNRGIVYFSKQEFERAVADFDRAIELQPNWAEAYNNRGAAYYQLRKFEQALADYSQALSLNPNYVEAYTNRAFVFCAQGNLAQANFDVEKIRELGGWVDTRLVEILGGSGKKR